MGFGAFLVTFCAGKKSPGVWGRVAPERTSFREEESRCAPTRPTGGESALRGRVATEKPQLLGRRESVRSHLPGGRRI